MNVLVTGGNGQLGSEIKDLAQKYSAYTFFFTDVQDLDITDERSVRDFVDENTIGAILNCAAYTAVDKAEEEKDIADTVNFFAVKLLAQIAKEKSFKTYSYLDRLYF